MTIFRRLGSSSLHHVATSCEYSHQVAAFCNMFQHFQHVATVCNISQHFVAFCNILQHCVSFCSILHHFGQRFATLCSILYNFATFCNILQLFCKLAEVQEAKVLYFLAWLGSGWDLGGESVVFLYMDRWLAGVQGAKVGVQGAKVLYFCSWAWLWLGLWGRKCCVFIAGMALEWLRRLN